MNYCINDLILHLGWGRSGRDRMVAGLATTYAISTYHHYSCEFKITENQQQYNLDLISSL